MDIDKKNEKMLREAQELNEVFSLLRAIEKVDLTKLVEERQTPVERIFTAREKAVIERRLKTKVKKKSKRQHWKISKKKRATYYKEVAFPTRMRKLEQLVEGEGWYPVLANYWKNHGFQVILTREEWDEHISPSIPEGVVPYSRRYYTADPVISLDRIMIYPKGRTKGKPLFDGKDWYLQQLGYCL